MIRLSTKIRYGLRTLIYLASREDDSPVAIREIAEQQHIPRKYLECVVQLLKNGGLVSSLRGPDGGYSLARKPADILMSEVFEALEGPLVLVDCVENSKICSRTADCMAHRFYGWMQHELREKLVHKTLADVLQGK